MDTLIHWFEIPVADLERACAFYENVFATQLKRESFGETALAIFAYQPPATGGALCRSPRLRPGGSGCVPYLDGGADLAVPLARAEKLGARILLGKTLITREIGYMALFEDCEGNVIGLHSRP